MNLEDQPCKNCGETELHITAVTIVKSPLVHHELPMNKVKVVLSCFACHDVEIIPVGYVNKDVDERDLNPFKSVKSLAIRLAQEVYGKNCPLCKSPMTIRTRQRDGKQFFGCSNYPTCGYTESINPEVTLEERTE